MDLRSIWFLLIGVLYVGFFVLEGFDFGVGILLPILSRDPDPDQVDRKRRMMINTIGPHWDGNEVWLLTAGGATFAAFPEWYATMFSGFYLALFLVLLALIARGVAFEFRSKTEDPRWRKVFDWSIFVGSLLPPLLIVVALANIVQGVPIDADMQYVGSLFTLLNPYALLAGVAAVLTFTLYGAIFLSIKTTGELEQRAKVLAKRLWWVVIIVLIGFMVATYFSTEMVSQLGINPGVIPIAGAMAIVLAGYFIRRELGGWAFTMVGITIAVTVITLFMILYPRVMVSSLDPAWSLTINNASSSDYTLQVMTIVALFFVPIVLIYQGWSYYVFRQRLTEESHLEY